jgi:poly(A) polymerase
VRLLRGVRLAAKLDFTFSPETEAPIADLAPLLVDVPPARLFDETLKLFLAGHGIRSFELLRHYGLFRYLFPGAEAALSGPDGDRVEALIRRGLQNTDERVAAGKPVTPMFLFAVFLWHPVTARAEALREAGNTPMQALSIACDEIVRDQQAAVSIPRRITTPMKDIQMMQPRMTRTRGKRVLKVLDHPRFRAAYDLLVLRADVGDEKQELAEFWTQIQNETPGAREQSVTQPKTPGRRRRRRRPRKPGGDAGGQ